MTTCPVCNAKYVHNTLFCGECGSYLRKTRALGTDPLEQKQVEWLGDSFRPLSERQAELDVQRLTVRLRVSHGDQPREFEMPVTGPIRLGRIDPEQDIYPEVDLTESRALEYGVSREHASIFRRGDVVVVEDLGSTNGTLLNGKRLAPFLPKILQDGDQLQLGKLLIDVNFGTYQPQKTPAE